MALCCGTAHLSCATLEEYPLGNQKKAGVQNLLTEVYDATLMCGIDASAERIADYVLTQDIGVHRNNDLLVAIRLYKDFLALNGNIEPGQNMEHVRRQLDVFRVAQKDGDAVYDLTYYQNNHNLKHVTQADVDAVIAAKEFRKTYTFSVFKKVKIYPQIRALIQMLPCNPEDEMD